MKIKKDFWRNGKALWIQIIAFALAVILYSVCCYPIYTSSKARIMRQLYEDIHDMDLEELSEDDEETLGDYQKEKFETIIANENYEQIYTSRSSLKTTHARKYIENKIAQYTEEGTLVKEVVKVEKMLITGVAADKNTARISVMGVEDKPGTAFKIFNTLAKHNINVDIILQSVGRDGTKDITFTVSQDDLKEAMEVMEARKEALTIKEMNYNEKVAKVSIVGAGMLSNPGVAATMFESLSNSNININMISTSEIRITVLIDEKDADRALVAIHDGFGLED